MEMNTTNLSGETLSDHVRQSVEKYFAQLNGHESTGLYDLCIVTGKQIGRAHV